MATDSAKSSQANGDAVPNGLVDVKPSMDTSKVEDDPLKAARDGGWIIMADLRGGELI